jgi:uncharacterized protein YjdB
LEATVENPGQAMQGVVWSSSKPAVATVDAATGEVTAKMAGTTDIIATATDGSKKSAKLTIKVVCAPSEVEIRGSQGVAWGKRVNLTAEVGPAGVASQAVTWKIVAPADAKEAAKLATVNASTGTVTAKAVAGNVGQKISVVATTKVLGLGGGYVSSDPYVLTIMDRVAKIILKRGGVDVNPSVALTVPLSQGTLELTVQCQPAAAWQGVTWSTSNTKIATVDQNGLVTFVTKGTVAITATAADGTGVKAVAKLIITP